MNISKSNFCNFNILNNHHLLSSAEDSQSSSSKDEASDNHPVIKALNQILTAELTAINQYFLHSRILQDQGFQKLADLVYKSSLDEMKHADLIVQRILFLEGHPNLQALNKLRIGKDVDEILQNDLTLETEAAFRLKSSIQIAETNKDYVTKDLLKDILHSEEEHYSWLKVQLNLISTVGLANYCQSQIMMDESYELTNTE